MNRQQGEDFINPSTANYFDWREQNHVFERMAHFRFVYFNLSDNQRVPERVQGFRVSADFFPLIGVKPALGRSFVAEDENLGRDRIVLLSLVLVLGRFAGITVFNAAIMNHQT